PWFGAGYKYQGLLDKDQRLFAFSWVYGGSFCDISRWSRFACFIFSGLGCTGYSGAGFQESLWQLDVL
ncbi:MAG: hypothetical protein ACOX85_10670, partial [Candidatus Pararuminococcus gallinarum]